MSFREEVIGGHRLILGDALEVLPSLEAGSVAAVVTDPPYGIGLRNGDVDGHRSERWDSIPGDDSQRVGLAVIEWARAVGLPVVTFASPEKPWPGRWRNRIVWDKGPAVGGGGDIRTCLKRTWELIQVWNPGPYFGGRQESVWRYWITPADTAAHIAAKPVPLMARLLNTFAPAVSTVLDPFVGSGTTLVAAVQTGRRGIGIEVDENYFRIAVDRVTKAVKDQTDDLFPIAAPPPPPAPGLFPDPAP